MPCLISIIIILRDYGFFQRAERGQEPRPVTMNPAMIDEYPNIENFQQLLRG